MRTRPSLRHGLPYGWWRTELFALLVGVLVIGIVGAGLFSEWWIPR